MVPATVNLHCEVCLIIVLALLATDHDGLENKKWLIMGKDLRKPLVDALPVGARLTAIFASCHTGITLSNTPNAFQLLGSSMDANLAVR